MTGTEKGGGEAGGGGKGGRCPRLGLGNVSMASKPRGWTTGDRRKGLKGWRLRWD